MLSYRHAFHAGNHADVLKHMVLVQALDYMTSKDAPLWYIDTHAGAGRYSFTRDTTRGHAEYHEGIGALWAAPSLPPALARYREVVRLSNPDGTLRRYPGSPSIARMLLPPQPRRALVMIDPSYELDEDYRAVLAALRDGLQRFASGVYLLWYPLLASRESRRLPERLEALGAQKWLHAQLLLRPIETGGKGLFGSGMFVINPPWTLRRALEESRSALLSTLAPGGDGSLEISAQGN